ncbi:hypothetical protein [Streptomyces sp. NPDC054783]
MASRAATKAYTGTGWNTAGPVPFGHHLYQGAYGEHANGRLGGLRRYATALPQADVAASGGTATFAQFD